MAVVYLVAIYIEIVSEAMTVVLMIRSFQALKFGVLVRVGGGVPLEMADIRLGDVVVVSWRRSLGLREVVESHSCKSMF